MTEGLGSPLSPSPPHKRPSGAAPALAHLGLVQQAIHSEDVGVRPDHDSMGWYLGQVAGCKLGHLGPGPVGTQQLVVLRRELSSPGLRTVA